jgi:hypothetical protein
MRIFLSLSFCMALAAAEIVLERRRLNAKVSAGTVTGKDAGKRIAMLWRLWFLLILVFALGGIVGLTR